MFNRQPWIILAPDFRSDWMGAEETDIVDAIRYAAELSQADPRRIGVFGGSNGGRLTLRAASLDPAVSSCLAVSSPFLTSPSGLFYARPDPAALVAGVARGQRLEHGDAQRLEIAVERSARRQGLSTEALVAERSVVSNAGAIRAPVLLITSRADEQVPHVMLESLIDALSQSGRLSKLAAPLKPVCMDFTGGATAKSGRERAWSEDICSAGGRGAGSRGGPRLFHPVLRSVPSLLTSRPHRDPARLDRRTRVRTGVDLESRGMRQPALRDLSADGQGRAS
jgi:dienelactone hydrolase